MENIRKQFIEKYGVEKVVIGNGIILDLSEDNFNRNKNTDTYKHLMKPILNTTYRIQGSYAVLAALSCPKQIIGKVFSDRIELYNIYALYLGIECNKHHIMHKFLDLDGEIHLAQCHWEQDADINLKALETTYQKVIDKRN